jgi:hypothetical protein
MPPTGPLSPEQISLVKAWIDQGAEWPDDLAYAHAGDRWWIQPLEDAPFTTVSSDGQWQARIHLGYEYAAFLVHRSFSTSPPKQPMVLPEVGGCIWAVGVEAGRK